MEQRKINEREDPRVLRTRHLLLQAFSDLFSEKGFHAMTVQDITERARVNRGTFYSHFEDKSAILEWWLREQFQQRVASTVLISDPWNLGTFRVLIQSVVEWFTQLHPLTRSADRSLIPLVVTTLQEALFELLLQGFKTVVSSGQDQQVDLETVALVTSWAIFPMFPSMGRADDGLATRRAGEPGDTRADEWLSTGIACFFTHLN